MKRNSYLLRRFGITEDQYVTLLSSQDGCCALCRRPAGDFRNSLAVDHDHHSREIRGILCFTCNKFLVGRRRKGMDAKLLRLAADYLDKEYIGWLVPIKKKKKRRIRKKRK